MQWRISGPHLNQSDLCNDVLRALPDWFGIEEAIVNYVREVNSLPTFVARDQNASACGFLTIKQHFDSAAEVFLIAVRPACHRRGIGRALVAQTERWLFERGVEYLQVKTLSPSRPDKHYDQTRRFYEAVGFRPLEEFPTLWSERNPCLLMVKKIEA